MSESDSDIIARFKERKLAKAVAAGQSPEEAAREMEALYAAAAVATERMALGICMVCDDESTDWRQVGRCIYAIPCGHRVGQGNAKAFKAGVLKARAARGAP